MQHRLDGGAPVRGEGRDIESIANKRQQHCLARERLHVGGSTADLQVCHYKLLFLNRYSHLVLYGSVVTKDMMCIQVHDHVVAVSGPESCQHSSQLSILYINSYKPGLSYLPSPPKLRGVLLSFLSNKSFA